MNDFETMPVQAEDREENEEARSEWEAEQEKRAEQEQQAEKGFLETEFKGIEP